MVRIDRVVTKTEDGGTMSLGDGTRLSKADDLLFVLSRRLNADGGEILRQPGANQWS